MATMSDQFAGKVAIVTGGTQGVGEAIARLLAERGAAGLVIVGRNAERGNAVADDIAAGGCPARFVGADLGDLDACRRIVPEAESAFGRVDVLVNAAALTDRGTILDTGPELFDSLFAANTRAPFFLMQDAATVMIRQGIEGAMVNILSVNVYGGAPRLIAYSGTKAALAAMTKSAAFSLMRNRIRVNALNLGWTDTPGEDRIQRLYHEGGDDWLAAAEAKAPFGRLLKPQEVARAVAFLASAESGMMTGALVDFDQQVIGCSDSAVWPQEAMTLQSPTR